MDEKKKCDSDSTVLVLNEISAASAVVRALSEEALHRTDIELTQLVGIGVLGAKGHTGDIVTLVHSSTRELLAVAKFYMKAVTYEAEHKALLLLGQILQDEPTCTVPEVLASRRVVLPNQAPGGILLMSAAKGVPLDDELIAIGKMTPNSPERAAAVSDLCEAVVMAAKTYALLHSRSEDKSQRQVNEAYLQSFIAQNEDMMVRFEERSKDFPALFERLGASFDVKQIRQAMTTITNAFLKNTGRPVIAHGDAHVGNLFWEKDTRHITLIDVPTANQSIDEAGRSRGSAARDVCNFIHKLAYHGSRARMQWREIKKLQECFLTSYAEAGGSYTPESFHFFHLRSALGEVTRAIKRDHNLSKGMIDYLNQCLSEASQFIRDHHLDDSSE